VDKVVVLPCSSRRQDRKMIEPIRQDLRAVI